MQISVEGKHVVITAGAGGAGKTIAESFHSEGADVSVCDISVEAIDALAVANPEIYCGRTDVGDACQMDEFLGNAITKFGQIDVLINNAGIAGPTALVEDISIEDWGSVFAANLSSFFYSVRRVVPSMKERRDGSIINISSASARVGLPYRLPYVVSKSAVIEFTRTLARELGPFNVRVNTILPGWINNERGRRVVSDKAKELGRQENELVEEMAEFISMRSMVEPSDIAAMALFLASPQASMVTGQHIGVCGNVEYER